MKLTQKILTESERFEQNPYLLGKELSMSEFLKMFAPVQQWFHVSQQIPELFANLDFNVAPDDRCGQFVHKNVKYIAKFNIRKQSVVVVESDVKLKQRGLK